MAIAIIPISTLQQYFLDKHSIPKDEQKRLFVSVLQAFERADLAQAMQHLYENHSDSWIRIRPEDFEELMDYYSHHVQSHTSHRPPVSKNEGDKKRSNVPILETDPSAF